MGCLILSMVQLPGADPRPSKQMVWERAPTANTDGRYSSQKQVDNARTCVQEEKDSQPGMGPQSLNKLLSDASSASLESIL